MAESGLTRFPVVEAEAGERHKLLGMLSVHDLLKARTLNLEAERRRECALPLKLRFHRRAAREREAETSQQRSG